MSGTKTVYRVQGMTCGKCASHIKDALSSHVDHVEISLKSKQVRLSGGVHADITQLNILLSEAGGYAFHELSGGGSKATGVLGVLSAYKHLWVVLGLVIAGTYYLHLRQPFGVSIDLVLMDFMGVFFIIFGFFKMLDLKGFKAAFGGYDIIASRVPIYGFVYPFIEIVLGIGYLMVFMPAALNIAAVILMLLNLASFIPALGGHKTARRACIGSTFSLPAGFIGILGSLTIIIFACALLYLDFT